MSVEATTAVCVLTSSALLADGKPVDVLEINGNISDKRAERIEDLLWNLIPEAGHLRDQVGRIDIANGAKSHPLALTQLLVGYHAVKAAMGVRAY